MCLTLTAHFNLYLQPHFKCSIVTWGWWLRILDSVALEPFNMLLLFFPWKATDSIPYNKLSDKRQEISNCLIWKHSCSLHYTWSSFNSLCPALCCPQALAPAVPSTWMLFPLVFPLANWAYPSISAGKLLPQSPSWPLFHSPSEFESPLILAP